MLGKMKQWLGIEGVKIEVIVTEKLILDRNRLEGTVRLYSKNAQTVTAIRLVLIEKYSRGRDEGQRTDEYVLGERVIQQEIEVPAEGIPVEIPFRLTFSPMRSPVEEFGRQNPVFQGLAWIAKKTRNASSEYRLEAEARVKGVGLDPFVQLPLEL